MEAHRDRAFLNLFDGLACARCGVEDGTIVACHVNGARAYAFGRGVSKKPSDYACAALCAVCHRQIDGTRSLLPLEHAEEFSYLIIKTYFQLWERGRIQVA